MSTHLEDSLVTQMIIPVSKETFFNTNWNSNRQQLCAYDMLYHPPNYNPKAARSDRLEPQIIRKNIWEQGDVELMRSLASDSFRKTLTGPLFFNIEFHKGIASTTHLQLSRPKWKPYDLPTKEFVRIQVKNENPHMRIDGVLQWTVLLNEGKPSSCNE